MPNNALQAGVLGLLLGVVAAAASPAKIPPRGANYTGSETCKPCHEEIFNSLLKTPHSALDRDPRRGWAAQGCEACHGPGAKHAESLSPGDIVNPAKLPAPQLDRNCLTCHLNRQTQAGKIVSGHAKDQVSCIACHSVHGTGGKMLVSRRAADINTQCASCHSAVWAAFQRPYKHRLPESAMSCVDCHNPHAAVRPQTMRASFGREPGCFQCHSDKRGPFTFEHAPVRLEGCMSCHEPHGSANPRMLTRHEQRFVCLECHANLPVPSTLTASSGHQGGIPPAFHDLRSARFQNCTVCHVKVHGSYVNRALLR